MTDDATQVAQVKPVTQGTQTRRNIIVVSLVVGGLILLAGLAFSLKLYMDTQQKLRALQTQLTTSTTPVTTDDKAVIDKVAKHMILPNETPKVVTIENVENLAREQVFFTKAKNGDKLIIYAQKVILYDSVLDKIIDMAQIRLGGSPTPQSK
jgi:hypothetical protein